jgi:hypothetical protein
MGKKALAGPPGCGSSVLVEGELMNPDEQMTVERQAELTTWLSEEASGFPGCSIEHDTEGGKYGYAWKVYLKDVQMGMIILTTEATLPEDKIRAHFRVELRKTLGQPA